MITAPSVTDRGEDLASQGFLRELRLLIRYRVPVLLTIGVVCVAAVMYSLLATQIFEAHTSILPADEPGMGLGALGQLIGELPIQGANLPGVTTSTDLLAGMLQSRRIQEPVAREFDLQKRYKAKTFDHALIRFGEEISMGVSDEGILHVRFRDKDREIAATVLNRLIEELNHFNVNERATRGRQNRQFVQTRLDETEAALQAAENELKEYQETNAVAISPEDMAAAETVGALIARRMALRVELDAIRQYLDPTSPPVVQRMSELAALDREISSLPEVGVQAVRLYRDLKVQEQLFLYLRSQLEQARIDENRDVPVIQVLDPATPPVLRAWPKRKLIVLAAFIASLVIGTLLAHALDFVEREKPALRAALRSAPR